MSPDFPRYSDPIPLLTTEQMIEVDRAMMEDYHIELIQMMENAGRNLAHLARARFFDGDPRGKRVVVLAGGGGNGGGALVGARYLANYGAHLVVITTKPTREFTAVPAHQLDILQSMRIPVRKSIDLSSLVPADLVIDGVIGYSLSGVPHGTAVELIQWANRQPAPILALDVPSGIDASQGVAFNPAIRAAATLTLALPKTGLFAPGVVPFVGELYLADISIPPQLYATPALQLEVGHIFAQSDIIRLS